MTSSFFAQRSGLHGPYSREGQAKVQAQYQLQLGYESQRIYHKLHHQLHQEASELQKGAVKLREELKGPKGYEYTLTKTAKFTRC